MDLQQLRYFISVAQNLSFSKASRHLYIAQPGLSQSIARLEKELGVKLMMRDRHTVKLTAAGKVFLNEAIDILSRLDDAIMKTHKARDDISNTISVGFLPSLGDKNLPHWIATFREKYNKVNVTLGLFTECTLHKALAEGKIDIGYARYLLSKNDPDMNWALVCTGTTSFITPKNHPLANRKSVKFIELCKEPLILIDKQECPRFYQFIMQYFRTRGIYPFIVDYARRLDGMLPLIASGAGVGIVSSCNHVVDNPEISFIQVEDGDSFFKIGFCWNKNNLNDNISLFVSHIMDQSYNSDNTHQCKYCQPITGDLSLS
ncbi:MAG: LysR family transcriptional regulator [Bacillota bacterium]|nr:LysR family transcriptional regulator [Bacillota bacterium]